MKTFLVLGMKRSGHHAIINWIGDNLDGGATHFNDCSRGWKEGKLIPSNQQSQGGKINGNGDNLIYNIEDFHPSNFKNYNLQNLQIFHNPTLVILVLRDPYNWIASSIKCGGGPKKFINRRVKIWKAQAKEYLNETRFINPPCGSYLVCLNFNDWFKDNEYKKEMSKTLDLQGWHTGIELVSPRGGGSSFDALRFNYKATQMKILERYKEFESDIFFKSLIDDELRHLSKLIFEEL